jgi:nicotinate phosphoribosyltransferase
MSVFNHQRLTNEILKLDIDRLRQGWYSDKYFVNITRMLSQCRLENYSYKGNHNRVAEKYDLSSAKPGDIEVEMQWFTRHPGKTIIVGVDKALAILKSCTGYWENEKFVNTSDHLQVWAVEDGVTSEYSGDPMRVQPVLRVRGRYGDFANLETPTLGILTRASRKTSPILPCEV